ERDLAELALGGRAPWPRAPLGGPRPGRRPPPRRRNDCRVLGGYASLRPPLGKASRGRPFRGLRFASPPARQSLAGPPTPPTKAPCVAGGPAGAPRFRTAARGAWGVRPREEAGKAHRRSRAWGTSRCW